MHIIGIQLIDGNNNIIKNLKKKDDKLSDGTVFNGWYPFCSYNTKITEPPEIGSSIQFDINYDFYKLFSDSKINISISCIVGKNGSGKSSLLELYYRIINNIGFCFQQIKKYEGCSLEYAFGFKAKLYFSIFENNNERIGCFEINDRDKNYLMFPEGKTVCLGNAKRYGEEESGYEWDVENHDNQIELKKLEQLFYSVVTNYSMYAFNPNEYDDNFYPYGIFHKNDAYTTPIVLLPYRNKEGVIDIDNERGLARQRTVSLQIFLYKKYQISVIENRIPLKLSYDFMYEDESISYNPFSEKLDRLNSILKKRFNKEIITIKPAKDISWKKTSYFQYYSSLKTSWKERLLQICNVNFEKINLNNDIKRRILSYLVYKTVKVCVNYDIFLDKFIFSNTSIAFNDIIDEIINDKTFITLKIRQCVEFIKKPLPIKDNLYETNYLDISDFYVEGKNIDDYLLKLPPAIFYTDLIYADPQNKKGLIKMSSFSSGEQQLLNSFNYVLYHLKNLECDKTDLSKNAEIEYPDYKNIVIVFDEAELYMHPEYQRQFIYKLISLINKCNFERIEQIQILIATHSPYILSDVPSQNLLMLEDGEIRYNKKTEQTFGANIYDLLKNQFFMSSPIGEIARLKMNEIIEYANCEDKNSIDDNKIVHFLEVVEKIGDSYLCNTLKYMLNKKR